MVRLRDDAAGTIGRHPTSSTSRAEYAERVCTGGFPLVLDRDTTARNRWFDDYIRTSVERDAAELTQVRRRQVLADLLGRLAGQTAQVLASSCRGGANRSRPGTGEPATATRSTSSWSSMTVGSWPSRSRQANGSPALDGLRKLRDALGSRFIAGVAVTTGPRSYTAEDRIHVLPADRLWRPNA